MTKIVPGASAARRKLRFLLAQGGAYTDSHSITNDDVAAIQQFPPEATGFEIFSVLATEVETDEGLIRVPSVEFKARHYLIARTADEAKQHEGKWTERVAHPDIRDKVRIFEMVPRPKSPRKSSAKVRRDTVAIAA